jgi:hypothetical protein
MAWWAMQDSNPPTGGQGGGQACDLLCGCSAWTGGMPRDMLTTRRRASV